MLSKTELSIFGRAGLLYSSTQNQTHYEYTDIVTGDLDFERLMNDEVKCWRLPVSAHAQELKQKKIIITDLETRFKIYTFNFVSSYEDRHLPEFELWIALLDHGFELYAWTDQLVQMKNIEDLLTYLFLIEPVQTNHLIEKLGKQGINKDECFFVTTENRAILQDNVFLNHNITFENSYRTLPNSLLTLLSLPYDLLQAYLDTRDQNIPFTIECNLATILNYDCTNFLKKIAYLKPEIHLCRLETNKLSRYNLFFENLKNFPPELTQYIKSFMIGDIPISEKRLIELFKTFTNLECLELRNVTVSKPALDPFEDVPVFNSLKKLCLSNIKLGRFHFCMLNNSPNLKELVLHDCESDIPDFPLKNESLKVSSINNDPGMVSNIEGQIEHDWDKFDIENFETKMETFLPLNLSAKKTNFLTSLKQKKLENIRSESSEQFDGDTGANSDTLTATEYFRPKKNTVNVDRYRLSNFRLGGLGKKLCFTPISAGDFVTLEVFQNNNLIDIYDEKYEETTNIFLGTLDVFPKDQNTWIKLPSFTPADEILMISTIDNGSADLRKHENNFHYIKINANSTEPVAFHFLLKIPDRAFQYSFPVNLFLPMINPENYFNLLRNIQFKQNGKYCLPGIFQMDLEHLQSLPREQIEYVLSEFCLGFSVQTLDGNDDTSPWRQLNQVIRERKGCCRHRAKVFVVLASIFGIDAELVQNDCHEFVLIWYPDGSWRIQDLGGAESQLETVNVNKAIEKRKEKAAFKNLTIDSNNPYICWRWQESEATTWKAYCTELLQSSARNILIALEQAQIENFLAHVQVLQKNNERQYTYIDKLDNIKTTQTVLGDNGEKDLQDSVLISRIKNARPGDVLVINWFEMKSEHLVYNTMMDTQKRMLKNTAFPEGLILISLQPNGRSISSDFHSRFQLRSQCPRNLLSNLPSVPVVNTLNDSQQKLLCINMYFPEEYKPLMTVKIASNGPRIKVIESLLITALKQGDPGIVLRNAPLNNFEFRTFLAELLYSRRFEANGCIYEIPSDFSLILWDKPYEVHKEYIEEQKYESGTEPADLKILNTLTFKSFFNKLYCDSQFHEITGWITQYAGQGLPVVITDTLSETHWALLSDEARKYNTKISVSWIKQDSAKSGNCPVLQATDLDLAEKLYFENTTQFTVIPVSSETRYNDLIERFEKHFDYFEHQICCVAGALLQGKHVVLKGELSPLLQTQLYSLLLPVPYLLINGQYHTFKPGQFRLLSTKAVTGHFFQSQTLVLPEPWYVLSTQFALPLIEQAKQICESFATLLPQEPAFGYIQLQTILQRLVQKPDANPLKSVLRLKSNYLELKPIIEQLWEAYDPVGKYMSFKPQDIIAHRIQKVCTELKFSPYVFVAGSSGSGKSTLFLRQWEQYIQGSKIYSGLEKIKDWVQSACTHPCLVIDEANLLSKDAFVFLELLFQNLVLIDGQLLHVSPRHKIIFIGNFGYFKDRNQQAFFNRHGHIITFKELPDSILKHHVLLPILSKFDLESHADMLLGSYQKIKSVNTSISIRNLEMLAWRFVNNIRCCKQHNESLCLALYDEFQIFFSDNDRRSFKKDLEAYKTMKTILKDTMMFHDSDFILTSGRRNTLRLIEQFLHIREQKINTKYYFTGKQGLILEGDSAEGKSSLVELYLNTNEYVLANEYNIDHPKRYYIIEDLQSLDPILFKAFHEGALVIINEMNTMPVELLLNHYMSGVDRDNQPAKRMGFAVLATQNPISFDFRKSLSAALLNRFQMICLKEYKPEEIKIITTTFCKQTEDAQKEAEQYLAARTYAKNQGFLKPNIRTLVNNCKKRKTAEDIDDREQKRVCRETVIARI